MNQVSTVGLDLAKYVFQPHGGLWQRSLLGGEIAKLGHTVKLIAPAYVKPFVKRQKSDMADAEAICEAAQRPTMRFVAGKVSRHRPQPLCFARGTCWFASAPRPSMRSAVT